MQPGDTITPGGQPTNPPEQPSAKEVEVSLHAADPAPPQAEAVPQPEPTPAEPEPAPVPEQTLPQPPEPETPPQEPAAAPPADAWRYEQEESPSTPAADKPPIQPVSWTASEYIAHQKSAAWFVATGAVMIVLLAGIYLVTKDIVASVVVALAGIIFAVFSARSPRVLDYAVNETGVQIGQRLYPYHEFKSFAVSQEGPLPAVLLMPLKRFLPPITVFYEPQSEDAIVNVLSSYLPFEQKQPDAVDKLMSRIRF